MFKECYACFFLHKNNYIKMFIKVFSKSVRPKNGISKFFKVWNSEINKRRRLPRGWIIGSSSSFSSSRAWVPFPAVSLLGNPHGCHQRLKAMVHKPLYIYFTLLYDLIIYTYMVCCLARQILTSFYFFW